MVELDQAELRAAGGRIPGPRSAAELAHGIGLLVAARLGGEGRRRSLARYACVVESVRDPELREILVPRENPGRDAVRDFLAAEGVEDPEGRTLTLLACVDGLVLDRVVGGGVSPRRRSKGWWRRHSGPPGRRVVDMQLNSCLS